MLNREKAENGSSGFPCLSRELTASWVVKGQGKGPPGGKRGVLILKVCKKLADVGGLGRPGHHCWSR